MPGIAPLEEQTQRALAPKSARQPEQKTERRKRPACHHIGMADLPPSGKIFDARLMYRGGGTRVTHHLGQKRAFPAIRLNEMYQVILMIREENGNHKSGETPAAAQIYPYSCIRSLREELRAVGEMPVPDIVQRRWRHQIYGALPLFQQRGVGLEFLHSFTWNRKGGSEIARSANMR